jgi:hypothetical protein
MANVTILTPLSIWMQLANFFFFWAGVQGDLLIIRLLLLIANAWIFLNALLGSPLWGSVNSNNPNDETYYLHLDSFIWAVLNMYVHGYSVVCLLLDERPVPLTETEAALWRLFYRTAGMSNKLYAEIILPFLAVVTYDQPDEEVPTDEYFYIIYRGHVDLRVYHRRDYPNASQPPAAEPLHQRSIGSGECFDIKYLQAAQIASSYQGRNAGLDGSLGLDDSIQNKTQGVTPKKLFQNHVIHVTTTSPCILFRFRRADLPKIISHPFSKSVWQAILINTLSMMVEAYLGDQGRSAANLDEESPSQPNAPLSRRHLESSRRRLQEDYVDRVFSPLEPWELPDKVVAGSGMAYQYPVQHIARYIKLSFSPPSIEPIEYLLSLLFFSGKRRSGNHPTGIRQTNLPPPPLKDPSRQHAYQLKMGSSQDPDTANGRVEAGTQAVGKTSSTGLDTYEASLLPRFHRMLSSVSTQGSH